MLQSILACDMALNWFLGNKGLMALRRSCQEFNVWSKVAIFFGNHKKDLENLGVVLMWLSIAAYSAAQEGISVLQALSCAWLVRERIPSITQSWEEKYFKVGLCSNARAHITGPELRRQRGIRLFMELSMVKTCLQVTLLYQPFLLPTALPCQPPWPGMCQLVQHGAGSSMCCLEQQVLLWKHYGFSNTGV